MLKVKVVQLLYSTRILIVILQNTQMSNLLELIAIIKANEKVHEFVPLRFRSVACHSHTCV